MILVLCVLPQILMLGNSIIEKTAFNVKAPDIVLKSSGGMLVNGWVTGKVSGVIDADVHGVIHGDINAVVRTGSINNIHKDDDEDPKLNDVKSIEDKTPDSNGESAKNESEEI